ncbi:hypothetical protein LSH36_133g02014 [Paralvinella palmiformis]|uniref:Outer dense fiber protein 3 n=1 Tax=Paralvinella palmiformis TaxID=53620 RepID=A0AAD9JXR8_9ANNE|nr:hypothetical protein LSH36_133g02014 [Paralvinella palmiformis]
MTVETTTRRGPIYAEYRPPAPIYERKTTVGEIDHCPTFYKAPGYSMGLKRRGYFFDPLLTHRGKKEAPSHSLSSRYATRPPDVTPGPGAYNSDRVQEGVISKEHKPNSITMAAKTKWPFKNEAPPPNTYKPRSGIGITAQTERQAPSWSLRPRTHVGGSHYATIKANIPGPGSYKSTEPNIFKKAAGNFSIQGRTKLKNYNSVIDNPGPGSYDPKPLACNKKGCSLGIRHSNYTIPLITEVADCY